MIIDAAILRKHLVSQKEIVVNRLTDTVAISGNTNSAHVNSILRDQAVANSLNCMIKALDDAIAEQGAV